MRKTFGVLFSSLLFFFSIGLYISSRLMHIKKKDEQLILKREMQSGRFDSDKFSALPKREIKITSPFGYAIHALLVEPYETTRYVIIAHGVTENKFNSVKYMNLFLERGYNALIYDHRRHGESGGKTTSYGYYEKFDLKAVVDWLKKEKGPTLSLGIHGESMGASTMLLYAGMLEDSADFYIADCPFSDFKEQLRYRLKKEIKLPPALFVSITDFFLRLRDQYSLAEISPISVIKKIKKPILFIHSEKDDFILPAMTKELYEQKEGPKMLYLAKNGLHAQSLNENSLDYEKAIDEFLHTYVEDEAAWG